jgi:hypothetical protein
MNYKILYILLSTDHKHTPLYNCTFLYTVSTRMQLSRLVYTTLCVSHFCTHNGMHHTHFIFNHKPWHPWVHSFQPVSNFILIAISHSHLCNIRVGLQHWQEPRHVKRNIFSHHIPNFTVYVWRLGYKQRHTLSTMGRELLSDSEWYNSCFCDSFVTALKIPIIFYTIWVRKLNICLFGH